MSHRNPGELLTLPLQPLLATVHGYTPAKLRADLLAGLTLCIQAIPQSMAYALIAGVAPIYGLYGIIVQGLVASALTSSSHVSIGPTNAMSLLVASVITRIEGGTGTDFLATYAMLALMAGLIQVIFALARLGGLTRYVSQSVIVGFAAGAGTLIAFNQVPNILGVPAERAESDLPGLIGLIQRFAPHLDVVNWRAVLIGLLSLAAVIACRWLTPRIPGPLVAVIVGMAIVIAAGWGGQQVDLVGELPRELPAPVAFDLSWQKVQMMVGGAMAVALLGMIEPVMMGRSIASKTGERIHPNREFMSVGAANLAGCWIGCYPASSSYVRSALAQAAGAKTRFAGIFSSLFVVLFILLLAPVGRFLPLASLAAILLVVAYSLIDWRHIRRLARTSRADTLVCLITLAAALVTHLEYAIFIGVFLNLALYVHNASRLHLAQMVPTQAGPFVERPVSDRLGGRRVMFLQVEGDLFFGVADELQDQLSRLMAGGMRIAILRLKRTHLIDATVMSVLERFAREMQSRGGHVLLCGVRPEMLDQFERFGLSEAIGRDNIFAAGFGVFTSAKRALSRARELAGGSLDVEGLELEDDPREAIDFQI